MKPQSTRQLFESLINDSKPKTQKNLRKMYEGFVVPYNQYLKKQRLILEVDLSRAQIDQIFQQAEKGAVTQGGNANKTLLGKLLPDTMAKKYADSLPAADAGPVEGFQAKAEAAAASAALAAAHPPSAMDQFVNNYVAPAYGTLQQAGSLVPNALSNPLVQHGLELAGIGYGAKKFLIDPFGNKMNNALDIMKNYTEKSHAAQMDYNALQREKMAAQAARTGAGAVNTAGESAFGNMAQQLGQRPPVTQIGRAHV